MGPLHSIIGPEYKMERLSVDDLRRYFLLDEQFADARKRIRSAQTLVIDEVWMLSKAIFEKVEFVCRLVRDNNSVFGGLQIIVSGDFKQLPPVPNYLYGDSGEYCFTSSRDGGDYFKM